MRKLQPIKSQITPTTLAYAFETVEYKNFCFDVWDLTPGFQRCVLRLMWTHLFSVFLAFVDYLLIFSLEYKCCNLGGGCQ